MNIMEKIFCTSGDAANGRNHSEDDSKSVPLKLMSSTNESCFADEESRFGRGDCTARTDLSSSIIRTNSPSLVTSSTANAYSSDLSNVRVELATAHPGERDQPMSQRYADPSGANSQNTGVRSKKSMAPRSMTIGASLDYDLESSPSQHRKMSSMKKNGGSANVSPANSTPTTPIGSVGKSHRFKFPAVKMGGFLFRKKSSWPTLSYAAAGSGSGESGTDEDRMNSPSNREKQKRQKGKRLKGTSGENTPGQRSPTYYNNLANGAANANETSPLLKRINNRLHLDRINRFSTASYPSCQDTCYCPNSTNGHRSYKRCASKEDPGPRTQTNHFSTAPAATLTAEEGTEAACSSGACKSASYPTAFGLDGKWGVEDGAYTLNTGTKYKLVKEGQIQVCRLNHSRTLLGKLTSSKLLRRWETHTLMLENDEVTSKTPCGFLEHPIKYSSMEDVHALPHWDSSGDKHCVRIFVPEGSILLQRNLYRYRRVIESNASRPEVILKEIKCMVELAMRTPLQGDQMSLKPVRLVCMVLKQISDGFLPKTMTDPVLSCVAPILDTIAAVSEISPWLIKYCEECPRSRLIGDVLSAVGHVTLKKNMDFGKYTSARLFVQEFLVAQSSQNDGLERVQAFVRSAHGPASSCPHPRVLPNLVSVCLAAIHGVYESSYGGTKASSPSTSTRHGNQQHQGQSCRIPIISIGSLLCGDASSLSSGSISSDDRNSIGGQVGGGGVDASRVSSPSIVSGLSSNADRFVPPIRDRPGSASQAITEQRLLCFCGVLETMSEFEDWRLHLASLLQPIPFPDDVLAQDAFGEPFGRLIRRIGSDHRCEVHLAVLGVREGKEGWFHLVCPGGPCCVDDGDLFASLLRTLLHCCCRRKKFLQSLNGMLGPLQLLSLRECEPAMEALCHMLEMEVVEGEDLKLQMITALQSTSSGKRQYAALCDRQIALRELQQKGGPRKLTLPSKSTDADLAVLLSSGSFGNLEWLSLAFTNVTSACAEYLIKLPSLRYLNLWSTQFGDLGLQTISEHLHKLQVLNLCETPVTDKGLSSLSALTNLRKLNLNSTQLSAKTFQMLRAKLPALQEVDVRYTDAWCADEFLAWSS